MTQLIIADDETAERVRSGRYSIRILDVPEPDQSSIIESVADVASVVGSGTTICVTLKSKFCLPDIQRFARILCAAHPNVSHFAVASINDGVRLRKCGVKQNIILLYAHSPKFSGLFAEYDLEPAIHSESWLEEARKRTSNRFKVHLWIDTGLGREGVLPEEARPLARNLDGVEIVGLATHLGGVPYMYPDGTIDQTVPVFDEEFTEAQRSRFEHVRKALSDHGIRPRYLHVANSGAIQKRLTNTYYDLVRPRRLIVERLASRKVSRVMAIRVKVDHTEVAAIKTLPVGWSVGYSSRTYLDKPMRVAFLEGSTVYGLGRARITFEKDHALYTLPVLLAHGRATVVQADGVPLKVGDRVSVNLPHGIDTEFFVPIDDSFDGVLEDTLRGNRIIVRGRWRLKTFFRAFDRTLFTKSQSSKYLKARPNA